MDDVKGQALRRLRGCARVLDLFVQVATLRAAPAAYGDAGGDAHMMEGEAGVKNICTDNSSSWSQPRSKSRLDGWVDIGPSFSAFYSCALTGSLRGARGKRARAHARTSACSSFPVRSQHHFVGYEGQLTFVRCTGAQAGRGEPGAGIQIGDACGRAWI
ncbi:hypothetical protein L227DRAFT_117045 [Lentinus tigrinus ALCF2SS1-6]|uniref:Uncharacterized protein n=1 Tax=Lentinus tigrinus ALCF2SS1-6 TaxID=1328759 RepID=A0A5C2S9E3_9APHY|nr:hypothetical protein L227DRAFT_117045 [Lentinus tigrinus ALCF2SS1-6]